MATGAVASCARQGVPPGGPEDRRPPVVVATVPDTFAVVTEPFRGPVVFTFNERISERVSSGTLAQAVTVSPRTGDVRVQHGRQSLTVEMQGGFLPGLVYRITLEPVVRDLFNNQLLAPFDLVFSTGGDFNASALAGTAWDRTNGEGVEALEVLALPAGDEGGAPHVARSDTGGVYVFRYLPPATYRLVAYQDRNRNGVVDPMELQGEAAVDVRGADTLFVDVPVLQPDTSPARLTRAQVVDSLTLVMDFDDYLDPLSAASLMGVTLQHEASGDLVTLEILHEREYVARRAQIQDSFARLDSLEAARRAEEAQLAAAEAPPAVPDSVVTDTAMVDTAAVADTAVVAADTAPRPAAQPARPGAARPDRPIPPALPAATGAGPRPGGAASAPGVEPLLPDGRPLPSRRLVLRLGEFLRVNEAYKLFAGSVVNLNGVSGGGGESAVVREPPPDTAAVDSAGAAADSLAAPPDTVRPDTAAADTIPPDTVRSGAHPLAFLPSRRR